MNILSNPYSHSLLQTTTDMPSVTPVKVSTPVKAETPVSQPRAVTPMKTTVKETVSYQPRSFTTRSGRTTQVPAKFQD